TTCTGGVVDGTPGCPAEGGDRVLPPGGPRRRARRADGKATRVVVLRREAREEVVQDQARGPLGSRDYGSRMGERPTGRLAVELLARRTGRQGRRVPDDWEDVQGPHGCGVPGDDGAVARPRDVRGALGIPCATRDGGRGRVQRDPTKPALPERIRTSLRADCAHSRRQRATGRRHIRAAQGPLRETVRTEGPGPGRSLTRAVAGTRVRDGRRFIPLLRGILRVPSRGREWTTPRPSWRGSPERGCSGRRRSDRCRGGPDPRRPPPRPSAPGRGGPRPGDSIRPVLQRGSGSRRAR